MTTSSNAGLDLGSDTRPVIDRWTVSVVIACRNPGPMLDRALQSVLDQTYRASEIIIVDDGSDDPASRFMFDSFLRPDTRTIRTQQAGLAEARNVGLREARGDLVSFLDVSIQLDPDYTDRMVRLLASSSAYSFVSGIDAFSSADPASHEVAEWTVGLLIEKLPCSMTSVVHRGAAVAVGGFDAEIPVDAYHDWNLAMRLLEQGHRGLVLPGVASKLQIAPRAAETHTTALDTSFYAILHYSVERYEDECKRNLHSILEGVARTTGGLENMTAASAKGRPAVVERSNQSSGSVGSVAVNRKTKARWPTHGLVRRFTDRLWSDRNSRVTIVLDVRQYGPHIVRTLDSLAPLRAIGTQIVVVDRAGDERERSRWIANALMRGDEIAALSGGATVARRAGLAMARAPILFALSAGDLLDVRVFLKAVRALESDAALTHVSCGIQDANTGFEWTPASCDVATVLASPRVGFPVIRRDALRSVGGYDARFNELRQADWDLLISMADASRTGRAIPETLVTLTYRGPETGSVARRRGEDMVNTIKKHRERFETHWAETIIGHAGYMLKLEHCSTTIEHDQTPPRVDWGTMRRITPISGVWGVDRGKPIDRHYIERFLNSHRADISGDVLEVKDKSYTSAFGHDVTSCDVIDIAEHNDAATIVGDLRSEATLPQGAFDCIILTQTLHIIYEMHDVIQNMARALRPGGVLLATLPCVSRVDYESGLNGDFWRVTPAAARRLFEDVFGRGNVELEAYGNVLICCSFLMGLAAEELAGEELQYLDPYFPLVVCVRAEKGKL